MSESQLLEFELCNASELPQNDTMKECEIDLGDDKKVKVIVVKYDNKFSCIAAKCTHYSVPLINGVLYKGRLRCFAHGACFDVATGDIEDYPGVDCLPSFEVNVDRKTGKVLLKATRQSLEQTKRVRQSASNIERPLSSLSLSGRVKSPSSRIPKCLIIGSGAAGLLAADTLREAGYGSKITILTKENHIPYDRPKLSKGFSFSINDIKLRDEEFFKTNQINFEKNQQVNKIDFDKKTVFSLSGKTFDYDKLIIATGLDATKSSRPGNDLKGIFTLRSFDDMQTIKSYFDKLKEELSSNGDDSKRLNVVSVGGSFIAMEAICFFSDKANSTVMSRHKPFETAFGSLVSNKIKKLHEDKNVKFFINENFEIHEFKESKERPGCLGSIQLHDNSIWPVDILILAIGGKPVTDFLKNTPIKLSLDNFVYVDKTMKTNLNDVYAVGDISFFPRSCLSGLENTSADKNPKLDHVNIGHWGVASLQGRTAAKSIISSQDVSASSSFNIVPFFWSVQYNKMVRFAGYNEKYDLIIFHEDKTNQNEYKFAAFYILQDKVVAACTLDWDPVCALVAEALQNKIVITRANISNDPLEVKKLLK